MVKEREEEEDRKRRGCNMRLLSVCEKDVRDRVVNIRAGGRL